MEMGRELPETFVATWQAEAVLLSDENSQPKRRGFRSSATTNKGTFTSYSIIVVA